MTSPWAWWGVYLAAVFCTSLGTGLFVLWWRKREAAMKKREWEAGFDFGYQQGYWNGTDDSEGMEREWPHKGSTE